MFIHVQRENGLAHRTMTLRPWQVQALRVLASRWFFAAFAAGLLGWGYFAVQAARVPFLLRRLDHMEQDEARLDSLQRTLSQIQGRYEQVQHMLSSTAKGNVVGKGAEDRRKDGVTAKFDTRKTKGAAVEKHDQQQDQNAGDKKPPVIEKKKPTPAVVVRTARTP